MQEVKKRQPAADGSGGKESQTPIAVRREFASIIGNLDRHYNESRLPIDLPEYFSYSPQAAPEETRAGGSYAGENNPPHSAIPFPSFFPLSADMRVPVLWAARLRRDSPAAGGNFTLTGINHANPDGRTDAHTGLAASGY
jgi:hypothetical protein